MKIEVSNGEIVDKYTILVIKSNRINDEAKLANVNKELKSLERALKKFSFRVDDMNELFIVNSKLWVVEDKIRKMASIADFGSMFIECAKDVYKLNDRRAAIKKRINLYSGSKFVEEKSY